jgi:glycosyltransferase involved in cell wall biosynthesis
VRDVPRVNPERLPVAIFVTSFEPGGTERQMTELVRRIDPARFEVHVVCFHRRGAWLPRVEPYAASVADFPINGFFKASTAQQMIRFARWCRSRGIVVLQTCDYYANVFGQSAGALAGVPVRIASRRDINPGRTRAQLAVQAASYRLAHCVVANSQAARDVVVAEGLSSERVLVIPNGVDTDVFGIRRQPRAARTIITVANLRAEKRHDVLLQAAHQLVTAGRDLQFQLVGDGPLRGVLERQAAAWGLSERVAFLGHRDDVPALLAAADVYVLSSDSEALPNGVLEAMAAGLPVVASAVGGLLNLVADCSTGLLVPPGDPRALAHAIDSLVSDEQRAWRIGHAAQQEVRATYSFDAMVRGFEALYERAPRMSRLGAVATSGAAPRL